MKTLMLSAVLLIAVSSCKEECEDEIRYNGMKKEVAELQDQITDLQEQLKKLDIDDDTPEFVTVQEELMDVLVIQAVLEIDMEVLKQQSTCF